MYKLFVVHVCFLLFSLVVKVHASEIYETQLSTDLGDLVIRSTCSIVDFDIEQVTETQSPKLTLQSMKLQHSNLCLIVRWVNYRIKIAVFLGDPLDHPAIQSDEKYHQTERVIDLLEEEQRRRSLEVERLRERVLELAKEVAGKDPFGHGALIGGGNNLGVVSALYQKMTDIDVDRVVIKAEIQSLRESLMMSPNHAKASELLDLNVTKIPEVQQQKVVIDGIVEQMNHLKGIMVHWETDKRYLSLQEKLKENYKKLALLKTILREQLGSPLTDNKSKELKLQIMTLQQSLAELDIKKKVIASRYDQQMKELKTGGSKSVQLEFSRSELAREEKVLELIAARKLSLQTRLGENSESNQRTMGYTKLYRIETRSDRIKLIRDNNAIIEFIVDQKSE